MDLGANWQHICSSLFFVDCYQVNTAIIGNTLLSLKPVVRTRRSYKRAGLIKQQKSFQGLAMYGHEVLMSLQTRAKFLGHILVRQ
jgi:hypothetical protein